MASSISSRPAGLAEIETKRACFDVAHPMTVDALRAGKPIVYQAALKGVAAQLVCWLKTEARSMFPPSLLDQVSKRVRIVLDDFIHLHVVWLLRSRRLQQFEGTVWIVESQNPQTQLHCEFEYSSVLRRKAACNRPASYDLTAGSWIAHGGGSCRQAASRSF